MQKYFFDFIKEFLIFFFILNLQEGRAGYTPLHIAVENNNTELATLLLENKKEINTETPNYRLVTAYQLARELDLNDICGTLEKNGCEIISPPETDSEDFDADDSIDFDSDNY